MVGANRSRIQHYGHREVKFSAVEAGAKERMMRLGFEVCDVRKPLAAVWRICEKGNIVQFGDSEEDCFIKSKATGEKLMMRRENGSYVLDVEMGASL